MLVPSTRHFGTGNLICVCYTYCVQYDAAKAETATLLRLLCGPVLPETRRGELLRTVSTCGIKFLALNPKP